MPKVVVSRNSAYPVYFLCPKLFWFSEDSIQEIEQHILDDWFRVRVEYERVQQEMKEYYECSK